MIHNVSKSNWFMVRGRGIWTLCFGGVGVIVISALWVVECRYRGVLFFECYIN